MTGIFQKTIDGHITPVPPVWLMRQAGRYLPEYREIRATTPSFLEFCYNPKLAAEATLQPIRRFGFDAAIMFSDILVMPDAFGQRVWFETGEGPRLEPLESAADISALRDEVNMTRLAPMLETLERCRSVLPVDTALIGFCGAPWTVASYMIAGKGTPDQGPARLFAYRHPETFAVLIDKLVRGSIAYLISQIDAGADTVQIFDSWAGVMPAGEFERWCLDPVQRIVEGVRRRHPGARIIAFPRGAGTRLAQCAGKIDAQVFGLDTAADIGWARSNLRPGVVLQGNLDPLVLIAGGRALDEAIDVISNVTRGKRHIFNLGHGILPETPIAHVEQMLKRVRCKGQA
ncbi:MAG: uroporphyrinogen decarboxylase [Beijerinckiaceae bacterium]